MLNRLTWVFSAVICVWIVGFALFMATLPKAPLLPHPQKMVTTDGIVVLTGGPDRIQKGFQLFKAGAGEHLFISGVHNDVRLGDIIPKDLTVDEKSRVNLGFTARSTRGNAAETVQWYIDTKIKSFYLVTAHYHLPRSLLEYKIALPHGIIYPYAVVSGDFKGVYTDALSPKGLFLFKEYNKYLVVLGRFWVVGLSGFLKRVMS